MRASRCRTPITFVVKAWSTGGSNETSPAQCTTASRFVRERGYVGEVTLDDDEAGLDERVDAACFLDSRGEDRLGQHGLDAVDA